MSLILAYRLISIQDRTGFVVLEHPPKGNLYDFLRINPSPKVPSEKGCDKPLAIK